MKDLARKIDSMRQFGYVLLTPKEAKRVAIELRRVERLKKQNAKLNNDLENIGNRLSGPWVQIFE